MVGNAAFGKIVRPYPFGAVSRTNLRFSFRSDLVILLLQQSLVEPRPQNFHRLILVFVLTALVLTLNYHSRRKMSYANGRLCFVYVLTARSRSAEHVYFQIGGIYLQFHLIGLSKHRNRYRGGMDTSLRFGLRHSLNSVYSAFVLKSGICPISLNRETYLLESAQFRLVCVEYLGLPAASLGVHGIHTEKRACKKRSLFASRAAAYFYNNVLVVVGVFGKQQYLQLFAKRF